MRRALAAFLCAVLLLGAAACSPVQKPLEPEPGTVTAGYDLTSPPQSVDGNGIALTGYEESAARLEAVFTQVTAVKDDLSGSLTGDARVYANQTVSWLDMLLRAYCVTLDARYIETASILCDNMYQRLSDPDGDGLLCFIHSQPGGAIETDAADNAAVVRAWADFILLVRTDALLSLAENPRGKTYGEQAARLLTAADRHILPTFDRYYDPLSMVYTDNGGAALPHAEYALMAAALYGMAKVSEERSAVYAERADLLTDTLKGYFSDLGETYLIRHADNVTGTHAAPESPASAGDMPALSLAVLASYERGGAFSFDDVKKLTGTVTGPMQKGTLAEPALSQYIDGSGDLSGLITGAMYGLQPFGVSVRQLGERMLDARQNSLSSDSGRLLQLHPEAPAPEAFTLSYPVNGALDVPASAALLWKPSRYATDYCIVVSKTEDFSEPVADRPYVSAPSVLLTGLLPGVTYYWKVIARTESGKTRESEVFSFTTAGPVKPEKRILRIKYRADTGGADDCSLEIYQNRRLMYVKNLKTSGWKSLALDLSEPCASLEGITLSLRLVRSDPSDTVRTLYIDRLELSGTPLPIISFEDGETPHYRMTAGSDSGGPTALQAVHGLRSFALVTPVTSAAPAYATLSVHLPFAGYETAGEDETETPEGTSPVE